MIKVRVLQVNTDPANTRDLTNAVNRSHTDQDGWQMPKHCEPGDLVVWYASGRQKFVARGRVESRPSKVKRGFGPYRGQVADVQWIREVDRKQVINDCGFDGGHQGPQYVSDEIAVNFLRSIGLQA